VAGVAYRATFGVVVLRRVATARRLPAVPRAMRLRRRPEVQVDPMTARKAPFAPTSPCTVPITSPDPRPSTRRHRRRLRPEASTAGEPDASPRAGGDRSYYPESAAAARTAAARLARSRLGRGASSSSARSIVNGVGGSWPASASKARCWANACRRWPSKCLPSPWRHLTPPWATGPGEWDTRAGTLMVAIPRLTPKPITRTGCWSGPFGPSGR
jgi:hypothetical protein